MSKKRGTPEYVRLIITIVAGLLTIALTGIAFWLSYEHLHDVAADHGLNGVRAWAWPATLDTFIVIGEALILRGSLAGRWDWWAVFLMSSGSVGSIVLNVTGVGSNGDALDYTVAAVPPVAALLAFGALMRQLHQAIKSYMNATGPVITPGARTVPAGVVTFDGDNEETTFDPLDYSPDAMRYEAGDQDGMDADLDSLRVPVSRRDEGDTFPSVRDSYVSPLRDSVAVPGTVFSEYTPPVPDYVPDNGGFMTPADVQTAVSASRPTGPGDNPLASVNGRPVPLSVPPAVRPRRRTTGITQTVRDMLGDNPGLTNEEIKEALPEANPESVKKSINRVRKELETD